MKLMKYTYLVFLICIMAASHSISAQEPKPNVIVIIIDDLNDYTETLGGHPQAETPGISRIESLGTTFINAHTSSPKCAPSRTSFLTGKDLAYTQVYKNPSCSPFREYFDASDDNGEVVTLPEHMKDKGGYFTYGINKIYHCFDSDYDFDFETEEPCEKQLSWNKYSLFFDGDDSIVREVGNALSDGVTGMAWAPIPDSLEKYMYDYRAIDSAALFIDQYVNDEINTCDKPFFMMIGLRKPHLAWFIPEKYFLHDYVSDFYMDPYNFPYNQPENAYPQNGLVMPPQPDTLYNDFYNLPEEGLGQFMGGYDSIYYDLYGSSFDILPLPEISPGLSDDERLAILERTIHANVTMAYLAATKFVDAQINRLMDSLENYPDVFENTIIVLLSDHGYSLGEKRHWQKGTLWETDLRVPFAIADLRNPVKQSVNSTVSLLDVFPTLCDMTGTPHPVFSDSSDYLDGISLLPMLEDPSIISEHPVLASYAEHTGQQCSCYPQYSVRNDRFHYIYYTSNNAEGLLDCYGFNSFHEEELYEIGADRKTDPNEWHNLINNDDYAPVVSYLQQWLPDSNLYLQKTFKAIIETNPLDCFAAQDDTLHLSFEWFDTNGNIAIPTEALNYTWSNNLTDEVVSGTSAEFHFNSIDDDVFENNNRIMIYLQIFDSSGHIIAFDTRYFYFNSGYAPDADFSVLSGGGFTAHVSDFAIEGQYQSWWWDFGNGEQFFNEMPGPYTFDSPGTYPITLYFSYGNGCIDSVTHTFTTGTYDYFKDSLIFVIPNPAHDQVHVISKESALFGTLQICNIEGKIVKQVSIDISGANAIPVDISDLRPGIYFITYAGQTAYSASPFIVIH